MRAKQFMFREGMGPTERPNNIEGERPENEDRYARRNYDQMLAAWKEALHRLPADSELAVFTSDNRSVVLVQQYLAENKGELTPEEIFFLQATIELRKASDRLNNARNGKLTDLERQVTVLQEARSEAYERVQYDSPTVKLVKRSHSVDDLQGYLNTHQSNLAPE